MGSTVIDRLNDGLIWGRHWYDALLVVYLVIGFTIEAMLIDKEGWPVHWWHLGWSFVSKKVILAITFAYTLTLTPPPLSSVTTEGRVLRVLLGAAVTWELIALLHAKYKGWHLVQHRRGEMI